MKHYCFLISFAVVTVLAVNIADYKKEVAYTNRQIKSAGVKMHKVIQSLVCGPAPMDKVVFMLVAPDMALDESIENSKEKLQECIGYQTDLQKEISTVSHFETCRLSDLADTRRDLIKDVTIKLLNDVASGNHMGNIRHRGMCRLKGLKRSLSNPKSYIKEANVNGSTCRLTKINNETVIVSTMGWDF
ncbi:uncharacterized protein LOC126834188 isoform X2 [Adelges cooleyi]|uniref:uncharacterized protein LOC126834188 isoform X2 n=1 Tax=Adelges cooleyi TaxID=133065 RepID=UPI00217FBF77|nr:uncharacterized protein LOC126834188 isoform X2 [Adelges cooleyi]